MASSYPSSSTAWPRISTSKGASNPVAAQRPAGRPRAAPRLRGRVVRAPGRRSARSATCTTASRPPPLRPAGNQVVFPPQVGGVHHQTQVQRVLTRRPSRRLWARPTWANWGRVGSRATARPSPGRPEVTGSTAWANRSTAHSKGRPRPVPTGRLEGAGPQAGPSLDGLHHGPLAPGSTRLVGEVERTAGEHAVHGQAPVADLGHRPVGRRPRPAWGGAR